MVVIFARTEEDARTWAESHGVDIRDCIRPLSGNAIWRVREKPELVDRVVHLPDWEDSMEPYAMDEHRALMAVMRAVTIRASR